MKSIRSRLATEIESCAPSGEQTDESIKSLADTAEKLTKSARFLLGLVLSNLGSIELEPDEEAEINAAADVIRAAEEWKP